MSLDFHLAIDPCEHCGRETEVWWRNITHNLTEMAKEAGIYKALWSPDENGFKHARDIVGILEMGLTDLKTRPDHLQKFEATNGWGRYKHFVPFVESVLEACKSNPSALIEVSR